jgi:hypothetical protein
MGERRREREGGRKREGSCVKTSQARMVHHIFRWARGAWQTFRGACRGEYLPLQRERKEGKGGKGRERKEGKEGRGRGGYLCQNFTSEDGISVDITCFGEPGAPGKYVGRHVEGSTSLQKGKEGRKRRERREGKGGRRRRGPV